MTTAKALLHFAFVVALLVLVVGPDDSIAEIVNKSPRQTVLHLDTGDEVYDFVKYHTVEQLTKRTVGGRIKYSLGARIAGDDLVAHSAKNQTWSTQQNVAITLTYPTSGTGKQITFVAIQVDQTSNSGQAYVIKGGLHQRNIAIVVEAYATNFLNYDAQVYGV